jgi:hypothetical protein
MVPVILVGDSTTGRLCILDDGGDYYYYYYYYYSYYYFSIPVAARSKAWTSGRSVAWTVGLNTAGGMDICLLWVLCVDR